jgi:hypothetical protein
MLSKLALDLRLEAAEIQRRRQEVAVRLMSVSTAVRDINFCTINTRDLFELFCQYDDLFLEGRLARVFEQPDHRLTFRLSRRMTSTGGMTTYHRRESRGAGRARSADRQRHFEIAVSSTLLFGTNFDSESVSVGGINTEHRLDALQRIFEHELVHLLEMVLWDDSSCARRRFKGIVYRLFGHRESSHQLLTPAEVARRTYGLSPGDTVQFHHRGCRLTGVINGIQRRATVLVPDNRHGDVFSDGRRYQRFYVPLERLSRVGS